uniref:BZIP domain-containing protein n=1 Tax=Plectus sambesii TaxID=2011161 RepID=A0A914VQN8_9BILA
MPITWSSRTPSGSQPVSISIVKEIDRSYKETDSAVGARVPLIMRVSDMPSTESDSVDYSTASKAFSPIRGPDDLPPARKYERKPIVVKDSMNYQTKRAKNNEAVRKCRAKARMVQDELESEVHCLKMENEKLRSALEQKEEEIARLKEIFSVAGGLCTRKHVDDMS